MANGTPLLTSFGIANELKDYIIQQHVLDSDGEFPASPNARRVGGTSATTDDVAASLTIPDLQQLALTYTCWCCRTMGHNATECFKVRSIGYKVTKLEGNSNVSPDHSNNQGGRGGGRGRGGGNSTNSCGNSGNSGNSNNNSTPAPTATNSSSNTNPTTSSQSNNSTSSES